uniref:Uncharacterized protein n=1 Tax=Romanomermis culicivorax TaxID=13658 RepID=A0A915HUZ1_ROMCU
MNKPTSSSPISALVLKAVACGDATTLVGEVQFFHDKTKTKIFTSVVIQSMNILETLGRRANCLTQGRSRCFRFRETPAMERGERVDNCLYD